jgi:hypothetical protein
MEKIKGEKSFPLTQDLFHPQSAEVYQSSQLGWINSKNKKINGGNRFLLTQDLFHPQLAEMD